MNNLNDSSLGLLVLQTAVSFTTATRNSNICDICNKSFSTVGNLKRHKMIHSETKPFKCNQCDYKCNQKHSLTKHQLAHLKVKPFVCKQCGYSSSTRSNLTRHKKSKHQNNLYIKTQDSSASRLNSETTPLSYLLECPYCFDNFQIGPTYDKHFDSCLKKLLGLE